MTSPASVVLVFLDPAFPDGRLADAAQPQLMVTDQGATRGDGIFETMLAVRGSVRKIQAHLDRLDGSAAALDLSIPGQDDWRRAIATAIAEHQAQYPAPDAGDDELVVKLVVTRGVEGAGSPTAWVQVSPAPAAGRRQRETGIDVILLDRGYDSDVAERAPWLLMGAKTLSYAVNMAALRHARRQGADDVIFLSSDGRVLEGPTSTVLLAHVEESADGTAIKRLITPQLDSGILPGTSQGALFTAAKAAGWELGYGPLEPQDLLDADAVWLISSVRLLAPVNTIDGKQIGTPALQKELTAELTGLYAGIQ
ncbi:aminotransferase class IV [Pseudarthrobacter chlorophenolicus A6]|uniref:Aminotransferase class IV n=1 Tax=Pseudarthrobacter chlorophenolicus (strain ATCC 700700 / DSM 12829 / CIP 107037 / JCM 12360 / KCTC 9906 / NCIMB 13794 / A6) TaxID=452863 RepID=B8H6R7_PSECP|nr:aminodeoxychorismate lyase [Pseudarthrobacter chlorophenolicus]ACL41593.1 aminotransferase class IV [Pseudarthrobacter chlorophenolicus A6]SDQ61555.1 4-amino-4-deoxychorismate lyase [Pseudarthrobacter chlorophenolicus]